MSFEHTGQDPIIKVSKANNGWLVVVYHTNRDKDESPETVARREREKQEQQEKFIKEEEERIAKDLMRQASSMSLLADIAGRAQVKSIDKELESWKEEEEDEELTPEQLQEKITPLAKQLAKNSQPGNWFARSSSQVTWKKTVETFIFTDRKEMIDFVANMLEPVTE